MATLSFLKLTLMSIGFISLTCLTHKLFPSFSPLDIPAIYVSLTGHLKLPYLYLLLNCNILSIAASSLLYNTNQDNRNAEPEAQAEDMIAVERIELQPFVYEHELQQRQKHQRVDEEDVEEKNESCENNENVEIVMPKSESTGKENSAEKPLVSSRFSHRKPLKTSPEGGRVLRVLKQRRQDTLENTWKTITEGRAMPLNRHLKKCDTLENRGRCCSPVQVVRKSETFKDRSTNEERTGVKFKRREVPLSRDELNRRVEEFIKKFNEEMRMQRQESMDQYKQLVGH